MSRLPDLSFPIPPSSKVSFFRALPRWPSSSKDFQFSFDYLSPVALSALIPLIVFLALLLVFLTLLTCRYTRRQAVVDARLTSIKSFRRTSLSILLASLLFFLISVLISLGLLGNSVVHARARDALDVIKGFVTDVRRTGFAIADLFIHFNNRLTQFRASDVSDTMFADFAGLEIVRPALTAVQRYILSNFPPIAPLRQRLEQLITDVSNVISAIDKAVTIVYASVLALIFLQITGPGILFATDALPIHDRSRACRIVLHITFLFVPVLVSWALVGVTAATGNVVADVCFSLQEYRNVLLGSVTADEAFENAFVRSNVLCSNILRPEDLVSQINSTSDALVQSELVELTVKTLVNESATSIADAARWTGDEVLKFVDCSGLVEFSGSLESVACGRMGWSALEGIFDMWCAFLGLAILLSLAFLVSICGGRVARSLLVFPPENVKMDVEDMEDAREGGMDAALIDETGIETVVAHSFEDEMDMK